MSFWVKAKPNAKITRVTRWIDEKTVEIALHAPPKDGKANAELIQFLSDKLDVPKSSISIVSGTMAKLKRIEISSSYGFGDAKSLHRALTEDQPRLW